MTEREKDQLLTAILGDEQEASLQEATLLVGLRALRWRRRRRIAGYVSLLILPLGLLLAPIERQHKEVMLAQASVPAPKPKVERISTEELFALFPGRQLALVGSRGEQRLVFLDQARDGNRANSKGD